MSKNQQDSAAPVLRPEKTSPFRRAKGSLLVMSLLYIALGAVLVMYPGMSLTVLCRVVGGTILAGGLALLWRFAMGSAGFFLRQLLLIAGLVCVGVGGFLLLRPQVIIAAVPIVFGLFVIFDSLVRLGDVWQLRKTDTPPWGMLLLVFASIVLGAVMVYNPFAVQNTMVMAAGAILIVEGVMNLTTALYTHVQVRSYLKRHPEVLPSETTHESIQQGTADAVDVAYTAVDEGEKTPAASSLGQAASGQEAPQAEPSAPEQQEENT